MNDDAATANEVLFDHVCGLLHAGHRKKPHHTPLDTLNRLFVKHVVGQSRFDVHRPWLTSSNTVVTQETRSVGEFAGQTVVDAHDDTRPIVIIRHRGVERLVDGGDRARDTDSGPSHYTAFVLAVRD